MNNGAKVYDFEEMLRAYFLVAGFFVVRGVPLRIEGEDITDIDLWLYDKPTGTARRIQIVDAKFRVKPKASERLLWTKGLYETLDVSGAYVATSDTRKSLRKIAKKFGIQLLDGNDVGRIAESNKVSMPERLTDEELFNLVRRVDDSHRNKNFREKLDYVKSSIVDSFGVTSTVRALDSVTAFAKCAVTSHADSEAARVAGRLAYFSAAIAAVSLDFVSTEAPFRTIDDRREMLVNAVRYGTTDKDEVLEKLRVATSLIRKYVESGAGIAKTVQQGLKADLDAIPAEIVADQAVRMTKDGTLFSVGKDLERASYLKACPPFDDLETSTKSFLGAILDYCGIERSHFAKAWKNGGDGPKGIDSKAENSDEGGDPS